MNRYLKLAEFLVTTKQYGGVPAETMERMLRNRFPDEAALLHTYRLTVAISKATWCGGHVTDVDVNDPAGILGAA